jgi:hypothetical protein
MGEPPDSQEDLMAIVSLLARMRDLLAVYEAHPDEMTAGRVDVADGLSGIRAAPNAARVNSWRYRVAALLSSCRPMFSTERGEPSSHVATTYKDGNTPEWECGFRSVSTSSPGCKRSCPDT